MPPGASGPGCPFGLSANTGRLFIASGVESCLAQSVSMGRREEG